MVGDFVLDGFATMSYFTSTKFLWGGGEWE